MKQAQIQQVFIYITAILVMGFLAVMGYKIAIDLGDTRCEIEGHRFINDVEQKISRSTRYGSVTKAEIATPCKNHELCFVNASLIGGSPTWSSWPDPTNRYYTIKNSVEENIHYNVYLVEFKEDGATIPVLYNSNINTGSEEMVCLEEKNGQYVFLLLGLGQDGVYLYLPP